ncbi:MAG: hypothetical protein AAF297_06155, partial [Planctomycetota bacterium]
MLEDALGEPRRRLGEASARHAAMVEGDDLPRLDLTHERRAHDFERHRLARDAVRAVVEPPEHQRPPAPRVPRRLDAIGEQKQHAERALQPAERGRERIDLVALLGAREQVDHDLGVGSCVKEMAALGELMPEDLGVDQVAVVGNGDLRLAPPARPARDERLDDRLGVLGLRPAGGRVAVVPDRPADAGVVVAGLVRRAGRDEVGEDAITEDFGDKTHTQVPADFATVRDRHARRLLPAVLLG